MTDRRPLAVRLLSMYESVRVLEGTEGHATRAELAELLRELATEARKELPPGWCPQCGFRPSLGQSTNLCGPCVMGRRS